MEYQFTYFDEEDNNMEHTILINAKTDKEAIKKLDVETSQQIFSCIRGDGKTFTDEDF